MAQVTLEMIFEEVKLSKERFDKIDHSLAIIDRRLSLIENRLCNIEPFISVDNSHLVYRAAAKVA